MKYGLVMDGVFSGRVESFDSAPDPNPAKGAAWLPYTVQADPAFDPATQRLGPAQEAIVAGEVVRSRPVLSLDATEQLEHVILKRQQAYESGTLGLKSVGGGPAVALGFWVDAIVSELEARGAMVTPEMQALIAMRAGVKSNNPKPS